MHEWPIDPVSLTADLVRCASVTPRDDGALDLIAAALSPLGFACRRVDRGGIVNLIARFGADGPHFGFNGHTDVAPEGDPAHWTRPPFCAEIHEGELWGRGSVDMKSGVAAFCAAAASWAATRPRRGSVTLMITGDEEAEARHGTCAILDDLQARGAAPQACVVAEPTARARLGDMIKIGRRGSVSFHLTARGRQGHVAYPDRALNPLPALARLTDRLSRAQIDAGDAQFDPSTLAVTTFDVGNTADNVIPAEARATVNIRFGAAQSGAGLIAWIKAQAAQIATETGVGIAVAHRISGESFITLPGPLTDSARGAILAECGSEPVLSTSGGTSDARFIAPLMPVVEVGLAGRGLMHAVDERVLIAEIPALARIHRRMIDDFMRSDES